MTGKQLSPSYQTLLDQYSEVFSDELGLLKSTQAHLKVHSKPKFCNPHQVPFSLKEPLEKELARLECLGILQKVMHSEWAAPVVVVPKGDGIFTSMRRLQDDRQSGIGGGQVSIAEA